MSEKTCHADSGNGCDRLTDISHETGRQHRLPVRLQTRHHGHPKSDRWDVADVCRRPHRRHPRHLKDGPSLDSDDPPGGDG